MSWALQPLPEEYVHNSTESNKRQAVSVKCKLQREQAQCDTNQVEAQTAQQDTAVGTAGTHTTPQTARTAAGTAGTHTTPQTASTAAGTAGTHTTPQTASTAAAASSLPASVSDGEGYLPMDFTPKSSRQSSRVIFYSNVSIFQPTVEI